MHNEDIASGIEKLCKRSAALSEKSHRRESSVDRLPQGLIEIPFGGVVASPLGAERCQLVKGLPARLAVRAADPCRELEFCLDALSPRTHNVASLALGSPLLASCVETSPFQSRRLKSASGDGRH